MTKVGVRTMRGTVDGRSPSLTRTCLRAEKSSTRRRIRTTRTVRTIDWRPTATHVFTLGPQVQPSKARVSGASGRMPEKP
jgi:hypothetical protein